MVAMESEYIVHEAGMNFSPLFMFLICCAAVQVPHVCLGEYEHGHAC